eukprot:scaffold207902_cov27-Tisochrysis_lutea.AAC.6
MAYLIEEMDRASAGLRVHNAGATTTLAAIVVNAAIFPSRRRHGGTTLAAIHGRRALSRTLEALTDWALEWRAACLNDARFIAQPLIIERPGEADLR